MGGGLAIVGCECVIRVARISKQVAMSSCLDDDRSCSRVGPDGMSMSDAASIVCHLVALGVTCGLWVEELCVRTFRCSGDSACRNSRK